MLKQFTIQTDPDSSTDSGWGYWFGVLLFTPNSTQNFYHEFHVHVPVYKKNSYRLRIGSF